MIRITDPSDCCGCTACASVCPHGAITMQPDALGFLYPVTDSERCTDCGRCETVCAFNPHYDTRLNLDHPEAYAVRHKDLHEVETSRSGAAFIAISDEVLEQGGIIYGVGYEGHFRVAHQRAVTKEERDAFKGSKYVQSDLESTFRQVKKDLQEGRTVLFSGTPCQTAGLHSYIGSRLRDRLILVDIVCHGVPSPYIWRDNLAYLENKHGKQAVEVNFRNKQLFGWGGSHKETYRFADGTQIRGRRRSFTYLFYQHIMLRHSCGKCHFTNTRRPSDLTLADFWGWEKAVPGFNTDDKGVSLVLVNTEKGRELFRQTRDRVTFLPARLEDCLQPNLRQPTPIHPLRMAFEKDYAQKGFKYVLVKYGPRTWKRKLWMLGYKIRTCLTGSACR